MFDERISCLKEDAKILYPNIYILEVETITGDKILAFIGSNANELMTFHCLRFEELSLNQEIEQGKILLNKKICESKNTFSKKYEIPTKRKDTKKIKLFII